MGKCIGIKAAWGELDHVKDLLRQHFPQMEEGMLCTA